MNLFRSINYCLILAAPALAEATVLIVDGAEHGICHGLNTAMPASARPPFQSTCMNDGSGNIAVVRHAARTGGFGYELPVSIGDANREQLALGTGIHSAKMAASSAHLNDAQKVGSTVRYTAYFYIDEGFDDFQPAWHIQMQWKAYDEKRIDGDRYWSGQNPKISWGFRRLGSSAAEASPLQVVATVREAYPNDCSSFSYDLLTRESTMDRAAVPVPKRSWVKITTEIHFHDSKGRLRIWQGSGSNNQLIIDASNINTSSQLVADDTAKSGDTRCSYSELSGYKYTNPTHFSFGIANYLSGRSFDSANRETRSPHILFIDDILVESIEDEGSAAPNPPLLLEPLRP